MPKYRYLFLESTIALACLLFTQHSIAQESAGQGIQKNNNKRQENERRGDKVEKRSEDGRGVPSQADLSRFMVLDKNTDKKISEEEYANSRMKPILERADSNKDKTVTLEELNQFFTVQGQGQSPMGNGPGGERGPGGRGRGFGPFRPGVILPDFLMQQLNTSKEQREAIAKLQATIDAELAKILTPEQQEQLKQLSPPERVEPRTERRGELRDESPVRQRPTRESEEDDDDDED